MDCHLQPFKILSNTNHHLSHKEISSTLYILTLTPSFCVSLPSFDVICRYAVTCSFLRPSLRQSFAEGLTAAAAIMSFLISPPKGLPLSGRRERREERERIIAHSLTPIHNRVRGFLCWHDSILTWLNWFRSRLYIKFQFQILSTQHQGM